MSRRGIINFLYWNLAWIAIGFIMGFHIWNAPLSLFIKILLSISYLYFAGMIFFLIGNRFFTRYPNNLANKIMRCKLRKKYGDSYCVDCPESYSCPVG